MPGQTASSSAGASATSAQAEAPGAGATTSTNPAPSGGSQATGASTGMQQPNPFAMGGMGMNPFLMQQMYGG